MTTTDPKLIERIARAAELMVLAAGVIRDHASDAIRHYYGEDCDGHCLAEDLESAAELLPTAAAINEAAHQWQPIETVPDCQRVLLWCANVRRLEPASDAAPVGAVFGQARRFEDGELIVRGEGMTGSWNFTHWQPLPSPPAIEAKESHDECR